MLALIYFFFSQAFCADQCTYKSNLISITNDSSMDDIKDPYRPAFIRLTSPGCPYSPSSQAQWEKAASLYPQVNFVTVDCWNNSKICSLFGKSISTPLHGLFATNSATLISDSVIGNREELQNSPQLFLDQISKHTKLYPISSPLLNLSPMIIDSFYTAIDDPIMILYDSTCTDQVPFLNEWSKIANEVIFPNGDNPRIGLLDCSQYPEECKRWSHPYRVKTPRALIHSSKTGNYDVLDSTSNINSEKIDGFYSNALSRPPKPTPSPVPIEKVVTEVPSTDGYTVLENADLKKRTVETVKAEYKAAFVPPSSACNTASECEPRTLDSPSECPKILPSTDDHTNSLKIINFFRGLAGLDKDVTEDTTWSDQCYSTAINMHKIGKVPSDHIIKNQYAVPGYCGEESNIQVGKDSLLSENAMSVFEASYKLFKDEGAHNNGVVGHRRWLLHPNLKKIGIGFYPYKEEQFDGYRMMRPAVTVIRITEQNSLSYIENSVPTNLKFISWPPEGPFPIEHLPSNWHISHTDFRNAKLSDLRIFVRRDDGAELKIKQAYLETSSINKDSLIIQMTDEALKRCQIMRKITVTVFNDKSKHVYRFSFELFDKNDVTEVCLYSSDKSKCPETVTEEENKLGPNQYQSAIFSESTNPVKIHVVDSLKQNLSFTASTKFLLLGSSIEGKVQIGSQTVLDVQDPTQTNYEIIWSAKNKKIGKLETAKPAKSIFVNIQDDDEKISIYDLTFYTGDQTKFSLSKVIYAGVDKDVYYSISGVNENFIVSASSSPAYQEYSISSDSELDSQNIIKLDSIFDMINQNTNKRVIKIYVSSLDNEAPINLSCFIPGRKRDYQFIVVGGNVYLSCDMNISDVANSITFSKFRNNQYTYQFEVYKPPFNQHDSRNVCPLEMVTINDATFTGTSSSTVIMPYLKGDQSAIASNDLSNFYDIYQSDGAEDSSEISAIPSGSPKTRCIVITSGTFDSYKVTYNSDKKQYEPFVFRPVKGTENKPISLSLYEIDLGIQPSSPNAVQLYFENYQDLTLDMPSLMLFSGSYKSCLHMYHFDNCGSIKLVGNKDNIPTDPIEITDTIVLNNIDYGCKISTPAVFVQDSKSHDGSSIQTKSLTVSPKTRPSVKGIKVSESITVDSATLILDKCTLNNDIEINIKKTANWWPSISFQGTSLQPKTVNIDLGITTARAQLIADDSSEEYESHSLITGIDENSVATCDSIASKLKIENKGKFSIECSKDKTELIAVKGKENAPILTPEGEGDDDNNPGDDNSPDEKDPNKSGNKKKGLSDGAIAGIVIAVIVVVAAVIVGVILFVKYKNGKSKVSNQSE